MAASKRHTELRNMCTRWIDNRCIKMCALPECNIVGYVADFVAIARMNDSVHERYCLHSGLKAMSMSHVWQGKDLPFKDVINGDIDRHYVCVFEVKVSRSDFLNTFGGKDSGHAKARMEPVGTAHWVVAEKGICGPDELPDFWGLLEPYGSGLTERKRPKLNILPESHIHSMAFDMLWLQMNSRDSYFVQLRDMSESIKALQIAMRTNRTEAEIRGLLTAAGKACRGFI